MNAARFPYVRACFLGLLLGVSYMAVVCAYFVS